MTEQPVGTNVPALSWRQALRVYLEPASLRMLLLGFSAGLPLLLVFGTLSFWLREAGIDRTTIGHYRREPSLDCTHAPAPPWRPWS